jgi:hypothetical protein
MAVTGDERGDRSPRVHGLEVPGYAQIRLRLKHCLETVARVHDFLAEESVGDQLLAQFERLQQVMVSLENATVTDQEMDKIEVATNRLLEELKILFVHRDLGTIDPGMKH